jgi:hypothetical protein
MKAPPEREPRREGSLAWTEHPTDGGSSQPDGLPAYFIVEGDQLRQIAHETRAILRR